MKGTIVQQQPVMGQRRAGLNRIRARAKRMGYKPSDVRPFVLKLYAPLINGTNSLNFRMDQETSKYNGEIRLEKSDAFWVDKIGLAIHKVLIINGVEQPANTDLFHYADGNWFSAADEARDLRILYNSLLSVKTDQDIRLEEYDTRLLRVVPETQYVPASTGVAGQHDRPEQWPVYNESVMIDLETNFGLWGNKRNEINIRFGTGLANAIQGVDGAHKNYAVALLGGFNLVRGAEALTKSGAHLLFADSI